MIFVHIGMVVWSDKAQTLLERTKSNGHLHVDMYSVLSTWMALFFRKCFLYQGLESFLSGDSTGKRAKWQLTREIRATCQLAMQSSSQTAQRKIN